MTVNSNSLVSTQSYRIFCTFVAQLVSEYFKTLA
jgi:hypothetical protein